MMQSTFCNAITQIKASPGALVNARRRSIIKGGVAVSMMAICRIKPIYG